MMYLARFLLMLLLFGTGCAYMIVKPVKDTDRTTRGYRFYDSQPAILAGCTETKLISIPDRSRGYAAQPRAWLAKNDYELDISNGMLTKTKGTLDSTAALTFLQNVATEAIKTAGTFAALSGSATTQPTEAKLFVFELNEDGSVKGLNEVGSLGPCPVVVKEVEKKKEEEEEEEKKGGERGATGGKKKPAGAGGS